jgi:hypothetical protein
MLGIGAVIFAAGVAASTVEAVSYQPGPADLVLFSFGQGRTLETRVIGPMAGGATAYRVVREAFNARPLCPSGPTTAIAVTRPGTGPARIDAVTGGLPGEPGAATCAVVGATISRP